jgi:hypothetical protein
MSPDRDVTTSEAKVLPGLLSLRLTGCGRRFARLDGTDRALGGGHRLERSLPADLAAFRSLLPKVRQDVRGQLLRHGPILTRLGCLISSYLSSKGGLGMIGE